MHNKWNLTCEREGLDQTFGTLWELVWYLEHNTAMHGNQPISFKGINNKDRKIVSATWESGFNKFIKRQVRKEAKSIISVYDLPNKRYIDFVISKNGKE